MKYARGYLSSWFCILFLSTMINAQDVLHYDTLEEVRFSYRDFSLVGNLYLPEGDAPQPLAVWVHGDGPDRRTGRFPGMAFFNTLLDQGFAYFRYDKPGTGDSKGRFSDSLLFRQRAGIVNAAVETLRGHPRIDSTRIGLAGSSQAGYVMPLVLQMRNDIAFMIGLALPAMTGNEQWAYLLKMQMICEGYSEEKAEEFSRMHLRLIRSSTYEEFLKHVRYFERNPIHLTSLSGYDENFAERVRRWWPLDWAKTQEFDPMDIISQTTIPVLAVYGKNDTQVDPQQGAQAYRERLQKADNPFFHVTILPGANHNMSVSETGCLKEMKEMKRSVMVPELANVLDAWLSELKVYLTESRR